MLIGSLAGSSFMGYLNVLKYYTYINRLHIFMPAHMLYKWQISIQFFHGPPLMPLLIPFLPLVKLSSQHPYARKCMLV